MDFLNYLQEIEHKFYQWHLKWFLDRMNQNNMKMV